MKIIFHPQATAELAQQTLWYDERRDGLGDAFLLAVDDALSLIVEAPNRWPAWPDCAPARRCLVSRFPFAVAYVARPDDVVILAVTHTHRQPVHWTDRLNDTPKR